MNRLQIFIISILFTVIFGLFNSASGRTMQPIQVTTLFDKNVNFTAYYEFFDQEIVN